MNNLEYSIVIVTKNRKEDLDITLNKLITIIDNSRVEILVLLDGCTDNTILLKSKYNLVRWFVLEKSIGASKARNIVYKNVRGEIIVGFDDDAHPLQADFLKRIESIYKKDTGIAVIAFQEIKGIFDSDLLALEAKSKKPVSFYCNEFVGCGFAIKTKDYLDTKGFPVWIDIYGEESCVSLEILSNNKKIIYTNYVSVNHRVDLVNRKKQGSNYYRFEKQLKNNFYYYLVYYKSPALKIMKLLYRNFFKYALKDFKYFRAFTRATFKAILNIPKILKYRDPVSDEVIIEKQKLKSPLF